MHYFIQVSTTYGNYYNLIRNDRLDALRYISKKIIIERLPNHE